MLGTRGGMMRGYLPLRAPKLRQRGVSPTRRTLRRLSPYLGQVAGKRIWIVQGSHGRIAVALAYLRADVTVINFSQENQRFAMELAAAAEVTID